MIPADGTVRGKHGAFDQAGAAPRSTRALRLDNSNYCMIGKISHKTFHSLELSLHKRTSYGLLFRKIIFYSQFCIQSNVKSLEHVGR